MTPNSHEPSQHTRSQRHTNHHPTHHSTRRAAASAALAVIATASLSACAAGGSDSETAESPTTSADSAATTASTANTETAPSSDNATTTNAQASSSAGSNASSSSSAPTPAGVGKLATAEDSCDPDATLEDSALREFISAGSAPVALLDPLDNSVSESIGTLTDFAIDTDEFDACDAASFVIATGTYEGNEVSVPFVFHWGVPVTDPSPVLSGSDLEVDNTEGVLSLTTTQPSGVDASAPREMQVEKQDSGAFTLRSNIGGMGDVAGVDLSDVNTTEGTYKQQAVSVNTGDASGELLCVAWEEGLECLSENGLEHPDFADKFTFFSKTAGSDALQTGNLQDTREGFLGNLTPEPLSNDSVRLGPPNYPMDITADDDAVTISFIDGVTIEIADGTWTPSTGR